MIHCDIICKGFSCVCLFGLQGDDVVSLCDQVIEEETGVMIGREDKAQEF